MFVVIFLARVLSISKYLVHILKNKIKKNHGNWLKNKKVIHSIKMPKKFKIFSLKIHKGAGIFKNLPYNFFYVQNFYFKIFWGF